jgi:hypothetical protein
MPRRRSWPQLAWPVHYKYMAPVSLFHISAVAVRAKSAQAVVDNNNFVRKSSGRAGKWFASFWVGSSVQFSFYSLAWCIYPLLAIDCSQYSLLGQGQGARRVASACGWVTRVSSMVKRAQSSIF